MSTTTTDLTGLAAGTWTIDPAHTDIGFTVRHLMVSKVRGTFETFEGTIVIADNPLDSRVEASIDVASITTNQDDRDAHLKSADFFEVDKYPTMTYASTKVVPVDGDYVVEGELTLKGVTKPVSLKLEFNGVGRDPWGGTRAGFSAEAEINRNDFGVDIKMPLDGGGVVVGDKIRINLEVEAVLQAPQS